MNIMKKFIYSRINNDDNDDKTISDLFKDYADLVSQSKYYDKFIIISSEKIYYRIPLFYNNKSMETSWQLFISKDELKPTELRSFPRDMLQVRLRKKKDKSYENEHIYEGISNCPEKYYNKKIYKVIIKKKDNKLYGSIWMLWDFFHKVCNFHIKIEAKTCDYMVEQLDQYKKQHSD